MELSHIKSLQIINKDDKTAKEWLHTEEYDFRERELMNKTQAVNFVGRQSVNNAIEV